MLAIFAASWPYPIRKFALILEASQTNLKTLIKKSRPKQLLLFDFKLSNVFSLFKIYFILSCKLITIRYYVNKIHRTAAQRRNAKVQNVEFAPRFNTYQLSTKKIGYRYRKFEKHANSILSKI